MESVFITEFHFVKPEFNVHIPCAGRANPTQYGAFLERDISGFIKAIRFLPVDDDEGNHIDSLTLKIGGVDWMTFMGETEITFPDQGFPSHLLKFHTFEVIARGTGRYVVRADIRTPTVEEREMSSPFSGKLSEGKTFTVKSGMAAVQLEHIRIKRELQESIGIDHGLFAFQCSVPLDQYNLRGEFAKYFDALGVVSIKRFSASYDSENILDVGYDNDRPILAGRVPKRGPKFMQHPILIRNDDIEGV